MAAINISKRVSRANRNPSLEGRSWCYFAQAGDDGPIKIGHTRKLSTRMRALQAMSAEPVRLLGALPETDLPEWRALAACRSARIRGEWHRPTSKVLELAAAGAAAYPNAAYSDVLTDEGWDALRVIRRLTNPTRSEERE